MKSFITKTKIKLYVNASYYLNKAAAKLKEQNGQAGEWVLTLIIGIVLVLLIGGVLIAFFSKEIEVWLKSTSTKISEFFALI